MREHSKAYLPRFLLAVLLLNILLSGCVTAAVSETTAPQAAALTVLAAASLTEAFQEIGAQYEQSHPGTQVTFSFAGSQQLAQQINEGAPADIFASADQDQINSASTSGRIIALLAQNFAQNQLVVITPPDNPAGITTLQDLSKPGIRIILADSNVPAGKYALEFLKKASESGSFDPTYLLSVTRNVVSYEENVRNVLAKVSLGEADAGIVYTTDASGNTKVSRIAIPADLNVTASYLISPLKDSPNLQAAQDFINYVLSPEGQSVLEKYGFLPADCGCDP
jgi:molybdate transport system substrate-binding protein